MAKPLNPYSIALLIISGIRLIESLRCKLLYCVWLCIEQNIYASFLQSLLILSQNLKKCQPIVTLFLQDIFLPSLPPLHRGKILYTSRRGKHNSEPTAL